MLSLKYVVFISSFLFMFEASAKLIQIIHTNDLHSYFTGTRTGKGGYARLKTKVDSLKHEARRKNITTLFLDAGDWSEGSSFFFSNKGSDSIRALDLLGVDVTTLGNHDYMQGGEELAQQINKVSLKAKIVAANLSGRNRMGLEGLVHDYIDINIDGMKVRVFGLITDSILFKYPLRPQGSVSSSHKKGIQMAKQGKKDGVDLLISLSHTGLEKDEALVQKTHSIDVVVSGHNMVKLAEPKVVKNSKGNLVPIVQAGGHSMAVGSLIIDVTEEGTRVVEYKLHDIDQSIAEDPQIKSFVDNAFIAREEYFGRKWSEVIGTSEIALNGNVEARQTENRTCWSKHVARLTRQSANADFGLQFDNFQGERIEAGPVTFGEMIDNFPHFREWGDKGWKVARAKVSGFLLNQMIKYIGRSGFEFGITIDGLQASIPGKEERENFLFSKHTIAQAESNGERINNLRFYTIGLPAEVPFAALKMSSFLGNWLFRDLEYLEDKSFWPLLEEYISSNSPIRCME